MSPSLRLAAVMMALLASAAGGCKSSSTTGQPSSGGGGGASSSSTGVGLAGGSTSTGNDAGPLTCVQAITNVPKGACDMLAQDCPAGQTCNVDNDQAPTTTVCNKTTGLKGTGEDCKAHTECKAGLICVQQCTAPCCTATNAPCGGGLCAVELQYSTVLHVEVCGYDKSCHVLEPEACPPGFGCHIADLKQGLATCTTPSPHPVDDLDACSYLNDCPDMEDCFDAGDNMGRHCRFYCFIDMSRGQPTPGLGGCPNGQSCLAVYKGVSVNVGLPGVGVCFAN